MKRLCALLIACVLLSGCAAVLASGGERQFSASFLDLFDTVTTVTGYAESEAAFRAQAQKIHDDLLSYHRLFDIYNEYPGMHNLKTINDNAGIAPVQVDKEIIALLKACRNYWEMSGGGVNICMGSVLSLWHDAREAALNDPAGARMPDGQALRAAARHADFDDLQIDEAASTVFLADPLLRLDVGAVAKGWAAQRVCERVPEETLVSVGGNICANGPKADGVPWRIGVQNPDGGAPLCVLALKKGSIVSSGDYQRCFWVDGERCHHIIDPASLHPAKLWHAVTVLCPDSGDGDALSTALFLMDRKAGEALLSRFDAEALWVGADGEISASDGFQEWILQTA